MAEPNYVGDKVSSLCSLGMRPLLMTGAIVEWLRQHFSAATNLEDPDLALENTEFVWSADPEATKVAIESATQWEPALAERRPALLVKRNDWRHRRVSIDNRVHGGVNPDGSRDYANLWLGSHTVFAVAGEAAECEKLAAEAYRELNQFAAQVRHQLNLTRLEMVSVGSVARLEEATENYAVPLNVGYAFFEVWKVYPKGPPLRAAAVQVN